MSTPSSSIKKGVCRRSLLKSVPMIAGAIISTNVVAQSLFAQAKLTHEASKYEDHPKDGQQCSNCVQFVSTCFMQGSGGSDRCERMVPTLRRQTRLGIFGFLLCAFNADNAAGPFNPQLCWVFLGKSPCCYSVASRRASFRNVGQRRGQ